MADVNVLTSNAFNAYDVPQYYDDLFLERAKLNLKYENLFVHKTIPENAGKVVFWDRMSPRTITGASLTEATTPDSVASSSTQVSATVAEKGSWERVSSLFSLTTFDKGLKERIEVMGQHAGEEIDTLHRDALYAGATVQLANAKAHASSIASTDTMSVVELRKAVKTLKRNKAPMWEDGFYHGVLSLSGISDLQGDSNQGNFVTANQYKTPDQIKNGEVGKIAGVVIFETNNEKTEATYSNVYSNFIGGKEAMATVDIAGKGTGLIMKESDKSDTSNPLNMYSTLAWKIPAFATATLNTNWVLNVKTYGV